MGNGGGIGRLRRALNELIPLVPPPSPSNHSVRPPAVILESLPALSVLLLLSPVVLSVVLPVVLSVVLSLAETKNAPSVVSDGALVRGRGGGLIQWGVRGWTFPGK
jgi:hypothetical protein